MRGGDDRRGGGGGPGGRFDRDGGRGGGNFNDRRDFGNYARFHELPSSRDYFQIQIQVQHSTEILKKNENLLTCKL